MKRNWIVFLATLCAVLIVLSGCAATPLPTDNSLGQFNNDLASGSYTHSITVNGIQLKTVYTTAYTSGRWMITSSKTLSTTVNVVEAPVGTRIQIEHIHVDTSLISHNAQLNGLSIDNMDDKLSAGQEAGTELDAAHPYTLIFSIEGFSKDLISGWTYVTTGTYGTITQQRLDEDSLTGAGKVYGQKFTYVYKVLTKGPSDLGWFESSWVDEFYVPVGDGPVIPTPTPLQ